MCCFALWAPSSHAFEAGSHGRCCAARDGHVRGGWDTWMDGFAVSNHACCGRAGMLVRPHGTRLHPTRVSACSQAYMLNTYSVVFTGGRNTCINTRVHSDPPRQPAAATEYSPLLFPPSRVRRPAMARPWERAATRGQPCFCCMHEALQALLERGYSGAGAGASAGAGACI